MRLDGVRLSTVDVGSVVASYRKLLGTGAVGLDDGVERFQLGRGAIEVARGAPSAAVCFAVERGDDLGAWPTTPDDHYGLDVRVVSEPLVDAAAAREDGIAAIDHVVIHTADADRAIAHWRDRLGLRLALDREFPDRGLRLLFFRSGGITLEFASPLGAPPATDDGAGTVADVVYGVSYRVHDIDRCRARLLDGGLDVGDVHDGMKPGTRVASVRSGTADIATLLIEDPSRA